MSNYQLYRNPLDTLCWLTECTLATVEHHECTKRPPKGELERQRTMAEGGVANLRQYGYTPEQARAIRCGRVANKLK